MQAYEYIPPTRALSPAQIIKSSEVAIVCDLRNAVKNLAANTYGILGEWKQKKKDPIDIEIDKLSSKIKPFINEEDEFESVEKQLVALITEEPTEETRLLTLVENLISKRRKFTILKNDIDFSFFRKTNLFGVGFFLFNLAANKYHITQNANYPVLTFAAEATWCTISIVCILWKKYKHQDSLNNKAKELRESAKKVYKEFSPNPPQLNPNSQTNQSGSITRYQNDLTARKIEREQKKDKPKKILKITNGEIGEV